MEAYKIYLYGLGTRLIIAAIIFGLMSSKVSELRVGMAGLTAVIVMANSK